MSTLFILASYRRFLTDERGYLRDEGLEIAFTDGDYAIHDSAESTTGYRALLKPSPVLDVGHKFDFDYPQPHC